MIPRKVLVLFTVCISTHPVISRPTESSDNDDQKAIDPLAYLSQFGYLTGSALVNETRTSNGPLLKLRLESEQATLRNAIIEFQDFAGLKLTGELDAETLEKMKQPRCGVQDKEHPRFKRYEAHYSRWPRTRLTYDIVNYPDDSVLTKAEVDHDIEVALKVWEAETPLHFERRRGGTVDIQMDFYRGVHLRGDDPFDGRGGVLAHAFFPKFGGDVHFDADEKWLNEKHRRRLGVRGAKQLLQTAVHEVGHSLGLRHSQDSQAIMAPFYRGWMDDVRLSRDDIRGIQSMYGPRVDKVDVVTRPSTARPTTSRPRPSRATTRRPQSTKRPLRPTTGSDDQLCSNSYIDAATETADGSFYVFRGDQYYKLSTLTSGYLSGYPRPTSDWSGLPGGIDAAFFNPDDQATYIFQGNKVGKYRNRQIEKGYPKLISSVFPGAPTHLDAALFWQKNNHVYLFQGSQYWKFNPSKLAKDSSYPRQISLNWIGLPRSISAALRWQNHKTFFFSGDQYYRFDDEAVSVDTSAEPPYPRPIGAWWLGCPREEPFEEEGGKRVPKRWIWS